MRFKLHAKSVKKALYANRNKVVLTGVVMPRHASGIVYIKSI